MIKLEIRLFGAFRKYESQLTAFQLCVDEPVSVEEIKETLNRRLCEWILNFSDTELIHDSAIANEHRILLPGESVGSSCVLSVLPPVCGG